MASNRYYYAKRYSETEDIIQKGQKRKSINPKLYNTILWYVNYNTLFGELLDSGWFEDNIKIDYSKKEVLNVDFTKFTTINGILSETLFNIEKAKQELLNCIWNTVKNMSTKEKIEFFGFDFDTTDNFSKKFTLLFFSDGIEEYKVENFVQNIKST